MANKQRCYGGVCTLLSTCGKELSRTIFETLMTQECYLCLMAYVEVRSFLIFDKILEFSTILLINFFIGGNPGQRWYADGLEEQVKTGNINESEWIELLQ